MLEKVMDLRQKIRLEGPEAVTDEELKQVIAELRESRVSAMDSGKKKKAKAKKAVEDVDVDALLGDI